MGGIELGKAPATHRGNEIDLFHVDSAIGTGCEVQADRIFVSMGRWSSRYSEAKPATIAASQSTLDPL